MSGICWPRGNPTRGAPGGNLWLAGLDTAVWAWPVTVGLLGGTFDPPHRGHVALAETSIRELGLDRLIVVVAGDPPHKAVATDAAIRFRLAQAAFAGLPHVELSRRELEQGGPSYTVDTARWADKVFEDAVFIVGADEFADFLTWREPDVVLEHIRLAVATRPGFPRELLDDVLARLDRAERVGFFELEPIPIASRDVRARIARGEPVDDLVPAPVARLIADLALYQA